MKTLTQLALAAVLALVVAAGASAADTVDINRDDAATLAQVLVGVGPAKAEAIVRYREENGDFRSAEELSRVPGIGLATVEKNAGRIETGPRRRETRERD